MYSAELFKEIQEYISANYFAPQFSPAAPAMQPEASEIRPDRKNAAAKPSFFGSFAGPGAAKKYSAEADFSAGETVNHSEEAADLCPAFTASEIPYGDVEAESRTVEELRAELSCDTSDLEEELRRKLSGIDMGFGEMLLKMIDARGMTDAECYRRAQLNRSHFNKIKNDPGYNIQKETVMALALALSLSYEDAKAFLEKAGFAFSPSSKGDLIVECCIKKGIYDVGTVNELLYAFDQKLLGAGIRE